MNLISHFHLLKRNLPLILIITLVCFASSILLGQKIDKNSYETTIFLSIGTEKSVTLEDESIYDQVQAADQFSETIQGWFKNPMLIDKIATKIGFELTLSAKKQEKQNIIITYSSDSITNSNSIANAIEETLNSEIANYNSSTSHNFNIAIFDATTEQQSSKMPLIILMGLLLGFGLGIGLSYAYETIFYKASYKYQIEEILHRKTDVYIKRSSKNSGNKYLSAFLSSLQNKNLTFIGIDLKSEKIASNVKSIDKRLNINTIDLPNNLDKLNDIKKDTSIVLCQLGKTNLSQLETYSALLPEDYSLVILY